MSFFDQYQYEAESNKSLGQHYNLQVSRKESQPSVHGRKKYPCSKCNHKATTKKLSRTTPKGDT